MLESRENYLEAILMLKQELGQVRSIDIARKLNYSKPSVSRAVGILKKGGYILVDLRETQDADFAFCSDCGSAGTCGRGRCMPV